MEREKRMECSMGHLLDLRCCDLGLTSINSWGRFPSQCVIFIEMRALRSLSPTHPRGKERWGVGGNGDACHDKRTWILWLFLASSLPPLPPSLSHVHALQQWCPCHWRQWPWSRMEKKRKVFWRPGNLDWVNGSFTCPAFQRIAKGNCT